ncbi:MAG TPA: hypothetical protein VGH28_17830 [Polyangiaceae bacterium]
MIGFAFHEIMEGSVQRLGERFDRPFRFEVDVSTPKVIARVAMCDAEGSLRIDGFAKDAHAKGRLEMSPLVERRIRYVLDFEADDGERYQFDGSKRIAPFGALPHTLLESWTTLPGLVTRASGATWGHALLRFHMGRDLRGLLASMRVGPGRLLKAAHV